MHACMHEHYHFPFFSSLLFPPSCLHQPLLHLLLSISLNPLHPSRRRLPSISCQILMTEFRLHHSDPLEHPTNLNHHVVIRIFSIWRRAKHIIAATSDTDFRYRHSCAKDIRGRGSDFWCLWRCTGIVQSWSLRDETSNTGNASVLLVGSRWTDIIFSTNMFGSRTEALGDHFAGIGR
jgi:hypothetical protein